MKMRTYNIWQKRVATGKEMKRIISGFTCGKISFDGPTSERDTDAAKGNLSEAGSMNWTRYYLMDQDDPGGDDDPGLEIENG